MKPVGYLINTREGLQGEAGLYYDYVLAQDGLFVRAASPHIRATVLAAGAPVRGLAPLQESLELPLGKIPRHIYDLALSILATRPQEEHYLALTWEGEYRLRDPAQEGHGASVSYERLPSTVLDIHSHGPMKAFFSGTDNQDEQGLRLYMVIGRLDTLMPEFELRVGAYGYFASLWFDEVFGV